MDILRERSARARSEREAGAAAVEFALIVPLLMTCLLGIVEGGTRYTNQDAVSHYAAVAARDVAIDSTKSASTIVSNLKTANSDTRTYTVTTEPASAVCSGTSTQVKVTVSATLSSLSGFFGSYTVKGVGVARCEN